MEKVCIITKKLTLNVAGNLSLHLHVPVFVVCGQIEVFTKFVASVINLETFENVR
jgi:hypothetical protein